MSVLGLGTAAIGVANGAVTAVGKLSDLLMVPAKCLETWVEEPIRRYEHQRSEQSKDNDVRRDIERETGKEKVLSEQRMREEKHSNELLIRRETEIVKIITEIEQLKKDKEFERMKAVSDAMMEYQKELTRINVEAVQAIGSMRIDLQKKAYDLIHQQTVQYSELQERALIQAQSQLERIDSSNMSESSKAILSRGVDESLASIIRNASRFLDQLSTDISLINQDINIITTSGQQFIQRHLEEFKLITLSGENDSSKSLEHL